MSDDPDSLTAERATKVRELQDSIGEFMTAFAAVESLYLTVILGVLSTDQPAMEHIEELMDFSNRLKLMLRLTEDRYPAELPDAKVINTAAKKLSEHRNKIAHGAAMVSAGSFEPGAEFVVGIRKRKSERTVPKGFPWADSFTDLMKKWFITTEEVRERIAEAVTLQARMQFFHSRLVGIRYGTAPAEPK